MLVGVGGSGKQSLARLASFICGYEVFQISVSSTYGVNDFKENLLNLYRKVRIHFRTPDQALIPTDREPSRIFPSIPPLSIPPLSPSSPPSLPPSGGHQGHADCVPDDGQPDRQGGLPRLHQRPAVDRLHRRPVHARGQGGLLQRSQERSQGSRWVWSGICKTGADPLFKPRQIRPNRPD